MDLSEPEHRILRRVSAGNGSFQLRDASIPAQERYARAVMVLEALERRGLLTVRGDVNGVVATLTLAGRQVAIEEA